MLRTALEFQAKHTAYRSQHWDPVTERRMTSRRATDTDVTFQNVSHLHEVVAAGALRGYGSPVTSLKDSIDQHYGRNASWSCDVTDARTPELKLNHSRSQDQQTHAHRADVIHDARDVRRHLSAPADTLHASSSVSSVTSSADSDLGDGYSNSAAVGAGALQRIAADPNPPVPLRHDSLRRVGSRSRDADDVIASSWYQPGIPRCGVKGA